MKNKVKFVLLAAAILFSLSVAAQDQPAQDQPSVADAARAAKAKKDKAQKKDGAKDSAPKNEEVPDSQKKKVFDDDNFEHQSSTGGSSGDDAKKPVQAPSGKTSAEEWKRIIGKQKEQIAALEKRIDQVQSSIHYVEANRYTNGPEYNAHQEQKQKAVDQMKDQLGQQKKALEDLQEACRKQGYSSSVYD